MPKFLQRLVTAAFVLFLLAAGGATLLRDKENVSFFENRALAAQPTYTAQSDGDGSYVRAWERYLSDHAAGRTTLLRVKAKADLFLRRPVVNDVVVTEGALLPYLPEESVTREEIAAQADAMAEQLAVIQSAVEGYGGYFCYVGIPCQYASRADEYPPYLNARAERSAWSVAELTRAATERGVDFLDMGAVFAAQSDPKRYASAVDNHYSLEGALLTYETLLARITERTSLDLPVLSQDDVTLRKLPNPYFGSRVRKLLGEAWREDALYYLEADEAVPFTRYDCGSAAPSAPILYHLPANDTAWVDYSLYLGGDLSEMLLDTARPELPSVLIYGDSFTNPLECILYHSFDKLYALDLRYYRDEPLLDRIERERPRVVVCIRDYEALLATGGNGGRE